MPTNIVEGTDMAIVITQHHDAFVGNLYGSIRTRFCNIGFMTDKLPGAVEDFSFLDPLILWIGVVARWDGL